MAYRGILFDLDGTLINSLDDLANSANQALKKNGLSAHPLDAYRYFVGDGVITLIRRIIGNRQDCFEAVLNDYRHIYAENCAALTRPYPGIPEMLAELNNKGLKVCVFSNKPDEDTRAVVNHYFPNFPFAVVRGSLPGVPVKPDPLGAQKVVNQLCIPKEELLYAGDTATDMACASNAGIASIGVTWGFRPRKELEEHGARWIVNHPLEILSLID